MIVVRREPASSPTGHPGRLDLPATPAAVGDARRHVLGCFSPRPGVSSDVVDLAVLLTSELVTNAVVHGGAPVVVQLYVHGTAVRVEVRDGGGAFGPAVPDEWSLTAEGGRGLPLVQALASAWGSTAHDVPRGKTIWFELSTAVGAA